MKRILDTNDTPRRRLVQDKMKFENDNLLFIFILMFGLFLFFTPVVLTNYIPAGDSFNHYGYINWITSEQKITHLNPYYYGDSVWDYPPAFHLFIAITKIVSGADLLTTSKYIPTFIGFLVTIFVFIIAKRLFQDKRVALLSFFFAVTSPIIIGQFSNYCKAQQLAILIFLILFYLLFCFETKRSNIICATTLAILFFLINARVGIMLYAATLFSCFIAVLIQKEFPKKIMILTSVLTFSFPIAVLIRPEIIGRYDIVTKIASTSMINPASTLIVVIIGILFVLGGFYLKKLTNNFEFVNRLDIFRELNILLLISLIFLCIYDLSLIPKSGIIFGSTYRPIFEYVRYVGAFLFIFSIYGMFSLPKKYESVLFLLCFTISIFLISKSTIWLEYFGGPFSDLSHYTGTASRYINMMSPFLAISSGAGVSYFYEKIKRNSLLNTVAIFLFSLFITGNLYHLAINKILPSFFLSLPNIGYLTSLTMITLFFGHWIFYRYTTKQWITIFIIMCIILTALFSVRQMSSSTLRNDLRESDWSYYNWIKKNTLKTDIILTNTGTAQLSTIGGIAERKPSINLGNMEAGKKGGAIMMYMFRNPTNTKTKEYMSDFGIKYITLDPFGASLYEYYGIDKTKVTTKINKNYNKVYISSEGEYSLYEVRND